MNRFLALALTAFAAAALVTVDIADARRLGGGRTFGAQRQSVQPAPAQPPAATPAPNAPPGAAANPVMPAQPGAAASRAAPGTAAAAPAASGASRWLGPIAGIAAVFGLAALAQYLGISEALMSVLLIALLAVAAIALLRFLFARRAPAASRPMQYAGTGPSGAEPRRSFEPVFGGTEPRAPAAATGAWKRPDLPAGFDAEPFLKQARTQFHRLQAAYDTADRAALADVMTPEMFTDVASDLDARRHHVPTEVVSLDAEIVEVATEGDQHWASVRFHGLVREDGEASPKPFDEVWNLVKPADGSSGWLLAGIQQRDEVPAGHA